MRYLIIIITSIIWNTIHAQKEVDAIVGLESDIIGLNYTAAITQPGLDYIISFRGEPYLTFAPKGFSFYTFNDLKVPVHVDEGDDFDLVVDQTMQLKDVYFKGDAGAVKNNYLLTRYFYIKEQERKADFLKDSKEQFVERIQVVEDSLVSIAIGLDVSQSFLDAERLYWKYYKYYYSTFYEVIKKPEKSDYYALPIPLENYPELTYDDDLFFQNHEYAVLMLQYYIASIEKASTFEDKSKVLNDLKKSYFIYYYLLEWIKKQVLIRDDDEEIYSKLYKRHYLSYYNENISEVHRKHRRFNKGSALPKIKAFDKFKNTVNIDNLGEKKTALFLFNVNDDNGLTNLNLWNQFYFSNKENFEQFVVIILNASVNPKLFYQLVEDNKIAGYLLGMSNSQSEKFLNKLGQFVLPTVLTVENKSVTNFNALNLFIFDQKDGSYPESNFFMPQLGKY